MSTYPDVARNKGRNSGSSGWLMAFSFGDKAMIRKGVSYVWTVEDTADLIKRWHENESIRSISKAFGCSHNVIVRHAARLDLPHREIELHPSSTGICEKYRKTRPEARAAFLASLIDTGFPTYSREKVVSLNCSWIVSDEKPAQYCNAQARRGKPYCEDHCAVAFREPSAWENRLLTGV
jgi:hypothetical protein